MRNAARERGTVQHMHLDATDYAIIEHLRRDGRLSNVALAEAVHLTPGPCLRRVQRLEAEGVIQGYAAQIGRASCRERV